MHGIVHDVCWRSTFEVVLLTLPKTIFYPCIILAN